MSSISRATIPQEFLDVTSAELLLQPEPEYFHAKLVLNAVRVNVDFGGNFGLPIPGREIKTEGFPGYPSLQQQMQDLIGNPDKVYSDAIKVVTDWQVKKPIGHTIKINRPKFTDSTYTKASRRVVVGSAISKTPIPIGSEQATITIERFAGPYDSTNGAVQPYGIERFDAMHMLHNPSALKELHLARDFRRSVDKWAVDLFDNGTAIYPSGMTADNDSTTAEDFPFSYELCTRVEQSLSDSKVPRFSNGRYMMIVTPKQMRQLRNDPLYLKVAQFHRDINPVFLANYRCTIGTLDIYESITLSTVTNGNSVSIQYGQAFGQQSVGWGMTEMPRVAPDTDDNFGETAKIIWLWYCGFEVLDSRFQLSVRSS